MNQQNKIDFLAEDAVKFYFEKSEFLTQLFSVTKVIATRFGRILSLTSTKRGFLVFEVP